MTEAPKPDRAAILAVHGDAETSVMLQQSVKRGGELMAVYRMDYPSLTEALHEIAADLAAGRVEAITVGGRDLSNAEIDALSSPS